MTTQASNFIPHGNKKKIMIMVSKQPSWGKWKVSN